MQGGMRSVGVIVVKVVSEISCSVITGVIASGISPLRGNSLNKAFGLAVGLGSARSGEGVF